MEQTVQSLLPDRTSGGRKHVVCTPSNQSERSDHYHQNDRQQREGYPKVNEILSPLLESTPVIRTFNVHTSTTHKIAAGKAA
jgi:hypothetical protein